MYDELVKRLRDAATMSEALAVLLPHSAGNATAKLYNEAADVIEELQKKYEAEYELRVKAFDRLCEWCAVCPLDKRDAATCEIANISEPQKEEEESS